MNRRQFITGMGVGVGVVAASTGAYGALVEPQRLGITYATRGSMLGAGMRVAHISDLHLHSITSVHEKLARAIAQVQPDVLVISGDTLDRAAKITLLPDLLELLPRVPHAFATLGNWEHQAGVDVARLAHTYRQHGIDLLVNRRADVGVLSVVGLDDSTAGTPDMRLAHRTDKPTILIAHSPGFRDTVRGRLAKRPDMKPDLMLSGHTHGGQITFFGWAPVRPRGSGRYLYGWYGRERDVRMFVSRGVGTTSIPVRLGAPPEIVVYDL